MDDGEEEDQEDKGGLFDYDFALLNKAQDKEPLMISTDRRRL